MVGSFFLPLAGWISTRLRNFAALCIVLISLALSLKLLPAALSGNISSFSLHLPLGFDLVLTADPLAVFMAIVSSLISTVIVAYSFGYISHYGNQGEYYFMVVLFLGSMMGLVFSSNLIFIYLFWEMTAFASWRLIGFFRESDHVRKADKAFLVTVFGALAMLLGFIIIYQRTGSFDLSAIRSALSGKPIPAAAALLILAGILSKSATLPFHTWLPDAGVAPSPVTALLHAAILVKIGVYIYARLFVATFTIAPVLHTAVLWTAAASALISAGAALIETDMKRIIAYSTVSQTAFIFLGFASGTNIGAAGALLYILMHGLAKGGLFLCAGIVEQNAKTKDITRLGGLINTMPVTALSFGFCAFSVMGIPPFGGFFSKYMVMTAAFSSGHTALAVTFLAGAVMTIIYLLRLFNAVFLGDAKSAPAAEGSKVMVFSVAMLAILSLIAGICINYPSGIAQLTVKHMLGM
jgi:NADH:ubiquinone oxidoreductase subunit 5 (subunit L)/multisubunit Na+/H+ antiporter MnhA subunit